MAKVFKKDKQGNILTVDQMLRRFKKQVEKEGIMQDLRKHEFFVPKGIRRAQKQARHQKLINKA